MSTESSAAPTETYAAKRMTPAIESCKTPLFSEVSTPHSSVTAMMTASAGSMTFPSSHTSARTEESSEE